MFRLDRAQDWMIVMIPEHGFTQALCRFSAGLLVVEVWE